jgi:hypothetical protein
MKLAYGSSASDMVQWTKQLTQMVSTDYFQFESQYGTTPSASCGARLLDLASADVPAGIIAE